MNSDTIPYENTPSLMEMFTNFIGWEMADVVSHIKENPSARESVLTNQVDNLERNNESLEKINDELRTQIGKLQVDLTQAENMIKFQEDEIESTNSLMDGHKNHMDYIVGKLDNICDSRLYRWFKWTI